MRKIIALAAVAFACVTAVFATPAAAAPTASVSVTAAHFEVGTPATVKYANLTTSGIQTCGCDGKPPSPYYVAGRTYYAEECGYISNNSTDCVLMGNAKFAMPKSGTGSLRVTLVAGQAPDCETEQCWVEIEPPDAGNQYSRFGARSSLLPKLELPKRSISIAASHSTVAHGKPVVFHGTVTPNSKGKKLLLQRKSGTKWVNVTSETLGATSKFSITVTPRTKGTFVYRAAVVADAHYLTSVSATRTLKVT